jgi:peptidoglycan/xylan/chitin deacetylase (PgdA/CDA1 family)
MYHRVARLEADPWGLAVSPRHFDEHLDVLRRHARPIPLVGLARAHQEGRIPRRAVAVTLDDGYADNLFHAKPLLVQHGVPATVFVTTGQIGRPEEFWWDELERLLLPTSPLPTSLELSVSGRIHRWQVAPAAASRRAVYYAVYDVLRRLAGAEREEVLRGIAAWAGATSGTRPTHRALSLAELRTLADGELIDIGAHSVTHPFLSTRTPEDQRREIRDSRQYLERELGRPILTFAYPHGESTPEALALVRGEFLCACSTSEGAVRRRTDRFRLPRFQVADCDGDEFARRLSRWLTHEG